MAADSVFLRKSSGVLRVMHGYDAMFFSYLVTGGLQYPIGMIAIYYGIAPFADWTIVILGTVVMCAVIALAYTMLSGAMPRSGGDYVFQSRALHPALGFGSNFFGQVIIASWWIYYLSVTMVGGHLPAMLFAVGESTGNDALMIASHWLMGQKLLLDVSGIVITVLIFVLVWQGLSVYSKIQRYFMMPTTVLALVLLVAQFLLYPREGFVTHVNHYASTVGYVGDYYQGAIKDAISLGFNPNGGSTWFDTMVMLSLVMIMVLWSVSTTILLGEIKGAEKLSTSFTFLLGGQLLTVFTWIVALPLTAYFVGVPFLRSVSWLTLNAPQESFNLLSFRGGFGLAALVTGSPIIAILIYLGLLGSALQAASNGPVTSTRMLLAMSFDRVLPSWFGAVSKKGVPYNALIFCFVVSVIFGLGTEYSPQIAYFTLVASLAPAICWFLTQIAATIFPWTSKSIWEASPGAKYRTGKVYYITIAGLIGTISLGFGCISQLVLPVVGISGDLAFYTIASIVLCTLYYFVAKWYRARQGIQLSLAFKQVPPA